MAKISDLIFYKATEDTNLHPMMGICNCLASEVCYFISVLYAPKGVSLYCEREKEVVPVKKVGDLV